MLDAIATKYAECATERLPLRYVLMFLFALLALSAANEVGSLDALDSFMSMKIMNVASRHFWIELDIAVSDLALAASVVAIGVVIERLSAEALFFLANRSTRFRARISENYLRIFRDDRDAAERLAILDVLEVAVKPVAKRFIASLSISQFCFSASVVMFIVHRSGMDAALGCALLFLAVASTIRSLTIFISKYYPLLALRQALLGLPKQVHPGLQG